MDGVLVNQKSATHDPNGMANKNAFIASFTSFHTFIKLPLLLSISEISGNKEDNKLEKPIAPAKAYNPNAPMIAKGFFQDIAVESLAENVLFWGMYWCLSKW
jgi:hypothetical protein